MPRSMLHSETQALATAEVLLRYAAENVKELPRATVATICGALDAQQANTWDEARATEFWCAFNALCELVKPATVDTLTIAAAPAPPSRWTTWFRPAKSVSLSQRTATSYRYLLIMLLGVSVVLGFLVSTTSGLSIDVEKLIAQNEELTGKLRAETDQLEAEVGTKDFEHAPEKQKAAIASIQPMLKQQGYLLDQLLQKNLMMTKLMMFGLGKSFAAGNFVPARNIDEVREAIRNYEIARTDVAGDRLNAQVAVGVLTSTVLPIVLGIMGACAYVVRLISEQIKDATFSTTSPIRHQVRVALGGLAGVVIGFGGVVTQIGLSSAALAFIAGYAVEPVFATLDGIAEKFRR
jgi:hypothetical protein